MSMLTSNQVESCVFETKDGCKYSCVDLLVDDRDWSINYLVLDKRRWNPFSQPIIINPTLIASLEADNHLAILRINDSELKEIAERNSAKHPEARRNKEQIFAAFGYAQYWMGAGITSTYPRPAEALDEPKVVETDLDENTSNHGYLRSMEELVGYRVENQKRRLGRAESFLCNTDEWKVSHCLSAEGFLHVKHWAMPVSEIREINWKDHKIH